MTATVTGRSHAVIGARGQIGQLLVTELSRRGHEVVAVASSWDGATQSGSGVERRTADAGDASLDRALAGCGTVYSVLGLPYRADIWQTRWLPLMRSVLTASRAAGCRLVYLDNLYAYGPHDGAINEDTPMRPVIRMGRARAEVAELLLTAASAGHPVVIGRSPDFVGPGAANSVAGQTLFRALVASSKPVRRVTWLGDPRTRHCWAPTPTVATSLALLGETDPLDAPVWMLPVLGPLTGLDFCAALGRVAGCSVRPRPVPPWAIRLAGLANPQLRAVADGLYHATADQIVDDSRWRARFPVDGPTLEEVLAEALMWFSTPANRPPTTAPPTPEKGGTITETGSD